MESGQNRKNNKKTLRTSLQKRIDLELRPYFLDGYSASWVVQKTGRSKDAVFTRFKEWTEEIVEKTDFIQIQKETKVRLVASLDNRIETYSRQIKRLEDAIAKSKTIQPTLELALTQANRSLTKLHIDKATVMVTPTLDITLRNVIKERWGIDIEAIEQVSATNSNST